MNTDDFWIVVALTYHVGYTKIMVATFSDTNEKIEKLQIEIIRRLPSWRKLAIVDDLNEMVKAFAISGIRQSHPEATAEQLQRLLAERMLGSELANKVYSHDR